MVEGRFQFKDASDRDVELYHLLYTTVFWKDGSAIPVDSNLAVQLHIHKEVQWLVFIRLYDNIDWSPWPILWQLPTSETSIQRNSRSVGVPKMAQPPKYIDSLSFIMAASEDSWDGVAVIAWPYKLVSY